MSRVKPLILVGLLLGVSALSVSITAAQEPDPAELEKRIQALETRLSNLERSFAQRVAALERQIKEGGQQANPLEGEAQQAYAQISRLAAEGKMDEAKKQMADFMTDDYAAKRHEKCYQADYYRGKDDRIAKDRNTDTDSQGIDACGDGQEQKGTDAELLFDPLLEIDAAFQQ